MSQERVLEQINAEDSLTARKKTFYIWPLVLSIIIVLLDQAVKRIVVLTIDPFEIVRVTDEFLWLVNVHNTGAMFSLGDGLVGLPRYIILLLIPILLLLGLAVIVIYSDWDKHLRWIMAGIIGGGLGNIIDRVFREEGVVDFISVKFYGIFGLSRWPTFNVADSVIVISMICWMTVTVFPSIFSRKKRLQHGE